MATVTIAATFGSGGSVVGPAVARRLGLDFIDRAIPMSLAMRIQEKPHDLGADELDEGGRLTGLIARAASAGVMFGVPLTGDPDPGGEVSRGEELLCKVANTGGAVILGRGGVFLFAGRRDTLHVRLDGPPEARVQQAMRHEGMDAEEAESRRKDLDRARAAYLRTYYPARRWEDPANYHLVLDGTALSFDACTEIVVLAARDRLGLAEVGEQAPGG